MRGWLSARVLVIVLALAGCGGGGSASSPESPPPPAPTPYPVGLSDQSLTSGGVTRQFRVHVPPGSGMPKAIVIVLHGGGGEGMNVANTGAHPLSVFRAVADREGFVVVYPGGLPATDGNAGWNDCRADNMVASSADDVGFLAALIERIRAEYGLGRARVFIAGGSNGAQMTHAFVFHRPELVAAAASGAGSLPLTPKAGPCTSGPGSPVPILLVHGTADTQMPYGGGCVANLGGACNRGRVIPAEATRDRWLQINGLVGASPALTVVERDPGDGGSANRFDHAGSFPVQWWRLDGAGHTVPSRTVLVGTNPLTGTQNRDVEFAEIVWSFFAARLP